MKFLKSTLSCFWIYGRSVYGLDLECTVEQRIPGILCTDGFTFVETEDKCVREEYYPARLNCLDGSHAMEGKCHLRYPALVSCPEEFTNHGAYCVKVEIATMLADCPSSFVLDGLSCIRHVTVELKKTCPKNSVRKGRRCFSKAVYQHSVHCPEPWKMVGSKCVSEQEVSCTNESDLLSPEVIDVCRKKSCNVSRRKVTIPEPSFATETLHSCITSVAFDPDVVCAGSEGVAWNGKTCFGLEEVDKVLTCPFHRTRTGRCVRIEKRIPSFRCPVSYQYHCAGKQPFNHPAKCQCQKIEKTSTIPFCSQGHELVTSATNVSMCVQEVKPIAYCPEADARLVEDEGVCRRVLKEPARLKSNITIECQGYNCIAQGKLQLKPFLEYQTHNTLESRIRHKQMKARKSILGTKKQILDFTAVEDR